MSHLISAPAPPPLVGTGAAALGISATDLSALIMAMQAGHTTPAPTVGTNRINVRIPPTQSTWFPRR